MNAPLGCTLSLGNFQPCSLITFLFFFAFFFFVFWYNFLALLDVCPKLLKLVSSAIPRNFCSTAFRNIVSTLPRTLVFGSSSSRNCAEPTSCDLSWKKNPKVSTYYIKFCVTYFLQYSYFLLKFHRGLLSFHKVNIFREGHENLRNLPFKSLRRFLHIYSAGLLFCGLLKIYT